jgi:hypothetical protein
MYSLIRLETSRWRKNISVRNEFEGKDWRRHANVLYHVYRHCTQLVSVVKRAFVLSNPPPRLTLGRSKLLDATFPVLSCGATHKFARSFRTSLVHPRETNRNT